MKKYPHEKFYKIVQLVVEGSVIDEAYPVQFLMN